MDAFPKQIVGWGADTLVSTLVVKVKDNETNEEETAHLTSVLEIKRSSPRIQPDGRSRIDLELVRWTARGPSAMLGKTIEYVVTPPQKQPPSEVVANQPGSDFPATIRFETVSDTYVGDEKISSQEPGHAVCDTATSVPPLGSDVFAIDKVLPYADGRYTITAVYCAACRMVVTARQRGLLAVGRRVGVVPEDFYREVLSLR